MNLFHIDFETWSGVPIRRGTEIYLNSAKELLVTYAIDDEPVNYADFTRGAALPRIAIECLRDPQFTKVAHNAFFDRMVLEKLFTLPTPVEQWHCTMAHALVHSLPGGLDPLCRVLAVPSDEAKIADGKRLIQKFCCGKKILYDDPEWPLFIQYAVNDITAMRACLKRMPNWNYVNQELQMWYEDQEINNRGFMVDMVLAENAIIAAKKEKTRLDDDIWIQTCGNVQAATQRDKLMVYLCEKQGLMLPNLKAATLETALEDDNLDAPTKALLRIRLAAAKTSASKFTRLKDSRGAGDRLRGALQYCGALRTGRWAGRGFQPHNLPRPTMKLADIRNVTEAIRNGQAEAVSLFAPIGQACTNVLRGLIIAPEGSSLFISDYSAVEGRALAWLAGEHWKVKAFADGVDLYCRIYERAFNLPEGTLTDKDPERQIGKVMELALGYQGGVGAFLSMAAVYRLNLEDMSKMVEPEYKSYQAWERALIDDTTFGLSERVYMACDTLKLRYREANPAIVRFWYQIEDAVRAVITNRDASQRVTVGPLIFDANNNWLRVELPSGRFLCYALPKIGARRKRKGRENMDEEPTEKGEISYMSWRNKDWVRTKSYGGKFTENIDQAVCRDLLRDAVLMMKREGYKVVLHVHDEPIAEVRNNSGLTLERFDKIMHTRPSWAVGFPIKAVSFSSQRYEKR